VQTLGALNLLGSIGDKKMQTFYHDALCACPRCEKSRLCALKIFGATSATVIYEVSSPSGKIYRVVVNRRTEIVTCNCPAGMHNFRATCSHAQRAWLEYQQPDTKTALDYQYVPLSIRQHEREFFPETEENFPTAEEIFG